MTKGTAANARYIDEQMKAANAGISEALKGLRNAMEAIKKGENEADIKLPTLVALEGALTIAGNAALRAGMDWEDFAAARSRRR